MPKKPHAEIQFGDRFTGEMNVFPLHLVPRMPVREDKEGKLRIFDGLREGWVDKADFVLLKDAPAYYSERLKEKPEDMWYLLIRGFSWLETGEYDSAIKDFDKYIELNPNNVNAYISRGAAWYHKKDYEKSIKDGDEAIRLEPDNAKAFNNRGNAHLFAKEFDKARKDFDEAIRLDPKDSLFLLNRANVGISQKEYDEAIHDYGEVIRLDPKFFAPYFNRGNAWLFKKDYDKAIADFSESIRLNPKYSAAFNNRGICWRSKKEYRKAIEDYDEAIWLEPKDISAMLNKGLLLATCRDDKWRDVAKAKELSEAIAKLTYENETEELLSVIAGAEGRFDDAIKHQKKALTYPEYAEREGDIARQRIKAYEQRKAWRE